MDLTTTYSPFYSTEFFYGNVSDRNYSEGFLEEGYETIDSVGPINERPETYFVPLLFLIIFVVGVLGNGTLIIIFMRHRTMRNVPNTYILSLALADLLVILTSVPFTSTIYTVENWPWGELICKISESAKDVSISVSIFTLTALSADRYFAIVDPLKKLHATGGSKKATRITIMIAVSIWLVAIVNSIPTAVCSHVHLFLSPDNETGVYVCYPFRQEWLSGRYAQTMVISRFLVLYVIPLSVIAVFYLDMANHLMVSTRNVPGEMQGTQRQIRARKKVAITVLIFVVVFAVCFLPTNVFMLWFYFVPNAEFHYNGYWHYTRILGFCLSYLNSCVNPVALYWISGAFRKHFNRYLLCIKPKRRRCDTCQGQHATSMSLVSMKRNQSICSRKGTINAGNAAGIVRANSLNQQATYRRNLLHNYQNGENNQHLVQETSILLLGNGDADNNKT